MTEATKAVPLEPTDAMVEAGCQAAQKHLTPWDNPSWDREPAQRDATREYVRDAIRAAIAAHGQ